MMQLDRNWLKQVLVTSAYAAQEFGNYEHVLHHRYATKLVDELLRAIEERDAIKSSLAKANSQAEHFEREWYLRGDRIEQLEQERDALAATVEVLRDALPYHREQTRPIQRTTDALDAIKDPAAILAARDARGKD